VSLRRQACTFTALLLLSAFVAAAQAQGPDPRIAGVYLEQARALEASGAHEAASRLASASLEFFPGSSEALFLLATIALRDQARTREAMDLLSRALAAGTWTQTDPDAARLAQAEVQVRTGRLADATSALRRLASRRPDDPKVFFLLASALLASGSLERADIEAAAAIRRFPGQEEIYLLASTISQREGDRAGARAAVSAGLGELPESLPLALRAAELEPEAPRRIRAVDAYDGRGGTDPLAAVIALEAAPQDPRKYLDLFFRRGGLTRADLTERVAAVAAARPELASDFQAGLSGFTGKASIDPDRNGITAEWWEYKEGKPVRWVRDADRDGIPEFSVVFQDGLPASLEVPGAGGGSMTFQFDPYPFIGSVTRSEAGFARTWILVPRTLGCPLLDGPGPLDPARPRVSPRFSVPSEAQVTASSFSLEERDPRGKLLRRVELAGGVRQYLEEDTDGDGVLDHKVWYSAGSPVRGLRDLNGSGSFSVSETFRDGRLWRTTADLDGDGKPDYAEERDGGRLVKMWDYDGDGTFDAREYSTAPGTVVREFSTARDGRFDLTVTWRDGIVSRVRRDGRSVSVTRDAAKGLVWIGTPPAGAAVDTGTREGLLTIAGRLYLAFRFGGILYIEEMR
jgi:tetratricopeptide (TPR) repeat protein